MKKIYYLLLTSALLMYACDDGKIYPKKVEEATGKKVILNSTFTGINAWPKAYQLAIAGFGKDAQTPIISKTIAMPKNEAETISLALNGITDDITDISVCVMTTGRSLIHRFYNLNIADSTNEVITLPIDKINVASFSRIQNQVFNLYCSRCHGAGNFAAADMYLTEGQSYEMLVNHLANTSTSGKLRVKPGLIGSSFIHNVLTSDIIGYNHTDVLPEEELVTLIDTWIENGAKNN
ncbi:hypothetical protein [uncultured Bacteroides sp.]|uniref:hypothetical protein n=1 Tax=uncultured Bacteroides sp. TaxID=162156 RepID=UPI002AAB509A|nr:hypothetical protein [uncultured Bacteroides sp.]